MRCRQMASGAELAHAGNACKGTESYWGTCWNIEFSSRPNRDPEARIYRGLPFPASLDMAPVYLRNDRVTAVQQ